MLAESKDLSEWDISTSTSKIDDSETITLSLTSKCKKATLIIRRDEGDLQAFINVGEHMAESSEVTTRIDNHKAVTRVWSVSTNQEAVFHPKSDTLVKALKNSELLIVRLTPYLQNPRTFEFQTKGFEHVSERLK